jgi:hypothetical protein
MQNVQKTPTPVSPSARHTNARQVMSTALSFGWNVTRALENIKRGIRPSKLDSTMNLTLHLR